MTLATIDTTQDQKTKGALYEILYQGIRPYLGFYVEEDNDRACFFCFNMECQGDYLYFPQDEIIVVESKDQHIAAIAVALKQEYDNLKWLTDLWRCG